MSAMFALTALILIVFLIYPTLIDIKNGSNEILSDREKVVLIQEEFGELYDFKERYQEYKINLEKIEKMFVDSKNYIDFIRFLEDIAFDSGVETDISLVSDSKDKKNNNSSATFFRISAKGDFLNILKFSEKLETGPYLIKIYNLTIKESKQSIALVNDLSDKLDANFLIEVITK